MSTIKKQVQNFNSYEFEESIKLLESSKDFIGYGTDSDSLEIVLLWRKFFQPSSFFGHIIAKNVSIVSEFKGLKDIWVTDSMGVCKNNIDADDTQIRINKAKDDNVPIIAFFGGSTMQGVGSYLPNFTIPSLVEQILLEEYNFKTVCINHGVAGWSSSEELNFLIHGLDYTPSHCIFYDGWNCVWNFYNGILLNNQFKTDSIIKWQKGTSLRHVEYDYQNLLQFSILWQIKKTSNLIFNKFLLYISKSLNIKFWRRLLQKISSIFFPYKRFNILYNLNNKSLSDDLRDNYLIQIATEYLRIDKIANLVCESRAINCIHFMQPTLLTTNRPYSLREMNLLELGDPLPNSEVFSLFTKFVNNEKPPKYLMDISDTFNQIDEEVFQDDGHLNPIGNYYVAKRIVKEIINKGYILVH